MNDDINYCPNCGTARTTPREEEISSEWPKPWLYSRVFMVFAVTFVILVSLLKLFHNVNAYPGIIFIGALAVPFSLLVMLMLDSMFSTGQLYYMQFGTCQ